MLLILKQTPSGIKWFIPDHYVLMSLTHSLREREREYVNDYHNYKLFYSKAVMNMYWLIDDVTLVVGWNTEFLMCCKKLIWHIISLRWQQSRRWSVSSHLWPDKPSIDLLFLISQLLYCILKWTNSLLSLGFDICALQRTYVCLYGRQNGTKQRLQNMEFVHEIANRVSEHFIVYCRFWSFATSNLHIDLIFILETTWWSSMISGKQCVTVTE